MTNRQAACVAALRSMAASHAATHASTTTRQQGTMQGAERGARSRAGRARQANTHVMKCGVGCRMWDKSLAVEEIEELLPRVAALRESSCPAAAPPHWKTLSRDSRASHVEDCQLRSGTAEQGASRLQYVRARRCWKQQTWARCLLVGGSIESSGESASPSRIGLGQT